MQNILIDDRFSLYYIGSKFSRFLQFLEQSNCEFKNIKLQLNSLGVDTENLKITKIKRGVRAIPKLENMKCNIFLENTKLSNETRYGCNLSQTPPK